LLLQVNLKKSIALLSLLYASALVFILRKTLFLWKFFVSFHLQTKLHCDQTIGMFGFRQNGRSFLGILDDVQSSLSLLDIPFTDINHMVLPQILFSPVCSLNEKPLARTLKMIYLSCASLPMQTSWNRCLYVEGASAIHPSSVAKVLQDVLLWTTFLIHQELVILVLQDCIHQYQLSFLSFQVNLDDYGSKVVDFKIIWSSSPDSLKYKSYFSLPELIEFPTEVPGQNAYAYFYPPSNPIYQASQEEKPPLLLKSHGACPWLYVNVYCYQLMKNEGKDFWSDNCDVISSIFIRQLWNWVQDISSW